MRRSLLLLSFIEGGAVMCAELCGARLLAPVFGTSLYIWASVMGITLGGLAAGYFAGGSVPVARQPKTLRLILVFASLYLLFMPVAANFFLPAISALPFVPAVVISTALLLLPPVAALGAASPLFIALQTSTGDQAGRVSGTVYAVSTAGGILSTFLCGFFLIPDLGLIFTLIVHGVLLLCATVIVFRQRWILPLLTGSAAIFATLSLQPHSGIVYEEDGIHGRLTVLELNEGGTKKRRLLVNNIIQTEIDQVTGESSLRYIALLDSLVPEATGAQKALVLGCGGGSAVNMLQRKGFQVTAVEFDERIIGIARRYFFLHPGTSIVHDDARRFINRDTNSYALIVADVFKAEEQPSHVLTKESLATIRKRLSDDGKLIVNWHGYTEGKAGEGSKVLFNTLSAAGFNYSIRFTERDPHYRNTLVTAKVGGVIQKQNDIVNTDNRPAMEKYNALANRLWRQNYLRYYRAIE